MPKTPPLKRLFQILLFTSLVFLLISFPVHLPEDVGVGDFRPYWSSSYLFSHHKDFGNPALIDDIERSLTDWHEPFTMHAWFAPFGNLIMMPFTFINFSTASYFWLITNIAILFLSSILLWQGSKSSVWLSIFITFFFCMTLISLICGQVNTLEVLGLALFLTFMKKEKFLFAGVSLGLTTIKPHLVILTLPILLLTFVRRKEWRVLAGFSGIMLIIFALLTAIYPPWFSSFWNSLSFGLGTFRQTPTINGLLVLMGNYTLGKWIWLIFLGITIVTWWYSKKRIDYRTMIDITLLVGLFIAPLGWSYDQIMLLLPILSIFEKIKNNRIGKRRRRLVIGAMIGINFVLYYQRTLEISDVWFFWTPLAIALIYYFVFHNHPEPLKSLHPENSTISA